MASIDGRPPDIAVEVEHASRRDEKRATYRACGVGELWDVGTPRAGGAAVFYDLRAQDAPRAGRASRILPDARAAGLGNAIAVLRTLGGPLAFAGRHDRGEPVASELLGVLCGATSPRPGEP